MRELKLGDYVVVKSGEQHEIFKQFIGKVNNIDRIQHTVTVVHPTTDARIDYWEHDIIAYSGNKDELRHIMRLNEKYVASYKNQLDVLKQLKESTIKHVGEYVSIKGELDG